MRASKQIALCLVTMLGLATPPALAAKHSENLKKCVNAAFSNSVQKGIKLAGRHVFNCHPAKKRATDSLVTYDGKISHHLRLRPDDQITYRIRMELGEFVPGAGRKCVILTPDWEINRGGFAPIPGAIVSLIGKPDFENTWREYGNAWDNPGGRTWEETAFEIIMATAESVSASNPSCEARWKPQPIASQGFQQLISAQQAKAQAMEAEESPPKAPPPKKPPPKLLAGGETVAVTGLPNKVSSVKQGNWALASGMADNTDRMGSDYRHFELSSATPEQCQKSCQADARCKAWTYVRPVVQGANAVCYLKDPAPAASSNACCISGVK